MPSTYTTRGYELMATGEKTDTWGTITNSNLSLIDQNISANLAVSTTGGTTTLTDSQASNLSITISGTLASSATVVFPNRGGLYFISNATSGSFTLTVKTSTGTGVTLQQGAQTVVYSDGSNMLYGNNSGATFVTGDLKFYFGSGAQTGWALCNGTTIGSATSGATQRANADCQALFYLLWAVTSLTVSGGRGASAAADWSANKTITTPDLRGRGIAGLDGMGTTAAGRLTSATISGGADTVGNTGGVETITLDTTMIPAHNHGATADVAGDHDHTVPLAYSGAVQAGTGSFAVGRLTQTNTTTSTAGSHTHTINVSNTGGGTSHNNVQPTMVLSIYIKL